MQIHPRFRTRTGPVLVILALVATTLGVGALSDTVGAAPVPTVSGVVSERPADGTLQFVDGETRSIAEVGDRVVVGGTFTQVGPAQLGAAGVVNTSTSSFGAAFPDVDGAIYTAVSDGAGGYYLGGEFAMVGGLPRQNLAYVDGAGTVSPWAPQANGIVRSLAVTADGVVIGGEFTSVNAATAARLARIDRTTGALVWNGNVTGGTVRTVAVNQFNGSVYVGGEFTAVGGNATRKRLASVDYVSGAVLAAFAPGTVNLTVREVEVVGTKVVVAGDFTKLNGVDRQRIALVDGVTGALDPFVVAVNGNVNAIEINAAGTTMYLVGAFGTVGGQARNRVASVDLTNATVGPITMNGAGDVLSAELDEASGSLFIGGTFVLQPERDMPRTLARINTSTGVASAVVGSPSLPLSLTRAKRSTGGVTALVSGGGSLLVAGDFSDYGLVARNKLAAYDRATGALDRSFDPSPSGEVYVVKSSTDGQSVFVGGEFNSIGGQPRANLAKLDVHSGAVAGGFNVSPDSYVKDLAVHPDGQRVFVGGNFRYLNGVLVERLASVDSSTGAILPGFTMPLTEPTNENSEGGLRSMNLSPDGTKLIVIGNFAKMAGLDRPLIGEIDVASSPAVVTSWRTSLFNQPCSSGRIGRMRDVAWDPDGSRIYVVTSGHYFYPACDSVNALPMTAPVDGVQPLWTKKIGDTLEAVVATDDAVYISGHFRNLEWEAQTHPRFQVGALNPDNGDGLSWNPNAGGFRGVLTLEAGQDGLYLGSDGETIGQLPHARFGRFNWPAPGVWTRTATWPQVAVPGTSVTHTVTVNNDGPTTATFTGLTHTTLGSLAGQGTCAVPPPLAPGASYTCQVDQVVSGAVGAMVEGTVTATGNTTAAFASSDRSTVLLAAADPTFSVRMVGGPLTIAYPGGSPLYNIAILNINQRQSLTLTSLTSSLHGDLNGTGECALPQTIAPGGTYWCRYSGPVSGSIGAKPLNSISAVGNYGGAPLTKTGSAQVAIDPPASGAPSTLVVGSTTPLGSSDIKLRDRLVTLGYSVEIVDDGLVTPETGQSAAVMVLSSTASQTLVGTKLRDSGTPVVVDDSVFTDEMGLAPAGTTNQGTVDATSIDVTNARSSLAAATFGATTVLTGAKPIPWAAAPAEATVIATVTTPSGAKPAFYAMEPGDPLVGGGTAANCRVVTPVNKNSVAKMNAAAWTYFDRAVRHAASNCGRGLIWTAAGNGTTTVSDGGQAVKAGLNSPLGIVLDGQGGYYIADTSNNRIRRVNAAGVISTVAGTGTAAYSGDGGQATNAALNNPHRITLAPDGALIIADTNNHRIRRVGSNGVITTIAGTGAGGSTGDNGQATAAKLKNPSDVSYDAAGNLFIADRANNRIRRVATNGIITTVAGNGTAGFAGDGGPATSARLYTPWSVDVDAQGNLLIADFDNNRIRKVAGGIITTVAGNGNAGNTGDGVPATEAELHKPNCVKALANGTFLICDYNNNRVRQVDDQGLMGTVVGTGEIGYTGDGNLAVWSTGNRFSSIDQDAAGNLYIVDRLNRRVRVVDPT